MGRRRNENKKITLNQMLRVVIGRNEQNSYALNNSIQYEKWKWNEMLKVTRIIGEKTKNLLSKNDRTFWQQFGTQKWYNFFNWRDLFIDHITFPKYITTVNPNSPKYSTNPYKNHM